VSPILVRPVREQLEHDRVIRLLQVKYKRRYAAAINPGADMTQGVGEGAEALYPDLVMMPVGHGRKVVAVVEVETQESVNAMEAMAQWAVFGRLPIEFWLFVPAVSVETARRLCLDNHIGVTEIWTYHTIGDQIRFTLVHRAPVEAKIAAARAAAHAVAAQKREAERLELAAKRAAARKARIASARRASTRPAVKPAKPAKPAVKGKHVVTKPKPAAAKQKAPAKKAVKGAKTARKR
jgi:hypothetical protein